MGEALWIIYYYAPRRLQDIVIKTDSQFVIDALMRKFTPSANRLQIRFLQRLWKKVKRGWRVRIEKVE